MSRIIVNIEGGGDAKNRNRLADALATVLTRKTGETAKLNFDDQRTLSAALPTLLEQAYAKADAIIEAEGNLLFSSPDVPPARG